MTALGLAAPLDPVRAPGTIPVLSHFGAVDLLPAGPAVITRDCRFVARATSPAKTRRVYCFRHAGTPDALAPGVSPAVEQFLVQELVAQRPIERFNECILLRLTGITVVPLDPVFAGPHQDRPAGELGPVIADDASRFAIESPPRIECACHLDARDTRFAHQTKVLAAGVIIDRQHAQLMGSAEFVGNEVHRPAVVRPQRHRHRRPAAMSTPATAQTAHRQTSHPIQPVEL